MPFTPDPKQFNKISKLLSAVSCSSSFLATTHFSTEPSRLLSIAVQACLSPFNLSCSRCYLITSTQVSMQPSESSLNSSGFLKVFLDLPPPLSLDSVFLVANASSVLFIISQLFVQFMASGATLECALVSLCILVEFYTPPFVAVSVNPDPMLLWI